MTRLHQENNRPKAALATKPVAQPASRTNAAELQDTNATLIAQQRDLAFTPED